MKSARESFDEWNDETGFVPKGTSYYYEIISVMEDHAESLKASLESAVADEWKEINRWKPYLHYCHTEWDGLLIDRNDPEFEACKCFDQKPKSSSELKMLHSMVSELEYAVDRWQEEELEWKQVEIENLELKAQLSAQRALNEGLMTINEKLKASLKLATDALEEVSMLMSHPAPGLSDFGESEHWKRESWSRRSTAIEALDALKSQKEK